MVVEALPTLIHVSVFLFFAGLAVFLWNVHLTIFKVVLSWISVCTALYGCITLIPIFHRDSPYRSPLTPLVRPIIIVMLFAFVLLFVGFDILASGCALCFSCRRMPRIFGHLTDWTIQILNTTQLTPEKVALNISSAIDTRALMWTFDSLDEDHGLECFFSGLIGFHDSKVIKEPLRDLDDWQKFTLLEAVIRLSDRTFSSNVLSDRAKRQRADVCANAIELVDTPSTFADIVLTLVTEEYGPAQSTEIVGFVRRWGDRNDEDTTLVQAMFSIVAARVQRHDDSWFLLASQELGIPETVLRDYAAHGDSLSLAILIYVTRQQFIHIREPSWPSKAISDVLRAASKFNINAQNTSPELQHEFCALWNQIVREARNGSSGIPGNILRPIRNLYIALHEGTNSAPTRFFSTTGDDDSLLWVRDSYPVCNVSGHIHNDSASTAIVHCVPHGDPAQFPTSLVTLVAPSFPLPEPSHVDKSLTTVPPLDIPHSTRQTAENFLVPATSPDAASAGAMRDQEQKRVIVTLTPQPAPEASVISYPPSSSVPPVAVLQPNVIPLAPPFPQTLLMPASSAPALDNDTPHAGPSLPFLSPQLYLTSHCLIA